MDECLHGWTNRWMNVCMDELMDGEFLHWWTNGWMNVCMDKIMDR